MIIFSCMKKISKEAASKRGLSLYYTGERCRRGHLSERYVLSGMCKKCAQLRGVNRHLSGIRRAVWDKSNGKCWYCGIMLSLDKRQFHVDHFISKANGGGDNVENLVPSCHLCNIRKFNKGIDDFRELMERMCHGVKFSKKQRDFFVEKNVKLPKVDKHVFWFERGDQ